MKITRKKILMKEECSCAFHISTYSNKYRMHHWGYKTQSTHKTVHTPLDNVSDCVSAILVHHLVSCEIQEISQYESCNISCHTIRNREGKEPKGKDHSHSDLTRQRAGHEKIKLETALWITIDNWHQKAPCCTADDTISKAWSGDLFLD